MAWVAVAIGGSALISGAASLIGSSKAASAAKQGAQIQADSANRAADLQKQEYDQTREDYAPYRAAGTAAVGRQADLLGLNGDTARDNAFSDFRSDPGYKFTVEQAVQGVDRSAAARGLLTSGATIKAIQDRASNLADQSYGNYFNRFAGLSGTGQTATSGTASAGATAAGNAGNALIAGGNATASGYTNAATANNNGLGGFTSALNGGVQNWLSYGGGGGVPFNSGGINAAANSAAVDGLYSNHIFAANGGI